MTGACPREAAIRRFYPSCVMPRSCLSGQLLIEIQNDPKLTFARGLAEEGCAIVLQAMRH